MENPKINNGGSEDTIFKQISKKNKSLKVEIEELKNDKSLNEEEKKVRLQVMIDKRQLAAGQKIQPTKSDNNFSLKLLLIVSFLAPFIIGSFALIIKKNKRKNPANFAVAR